MSNTLKTKKLKSTKISIDGIETSLYEVSKDIEVAKKTDFTFKVGTVEALLEKIQSLQEELDTVNKDNKYLDTRLNDVLANKEAEPKELKVYTEQPEKFSFVIPYHDHPRHMQLSNMHNLQKCISAMILMCSSDSIQTRLYNQQEFEEQNNNIMKYYQSGAGARDIIPDAVHAALLEAFKISKAVQQGLDLISI